MKLKIKNNLVVKSAHTPKIGEFWARYDDPNTLYLVCYDRQYYYLVNIRTGRSFKRDCESINDIFDEFEHEFYPIQGTISIEINPE